MAQFTLHAIVALKIRGQSANFNWPGGTGVLFVIGGSGASDPRTLRLVMFDPVNNQYTWPNFTPIGLSSFSAVGDLAVSFSGPPAQGIISITGPDDTLQSPVDVWIIGS